MIKSSNFPNAYKEVYIILKYVDSEDLKLIPKSFINMLEQNMNDDYKFEFDPNIEFENQKLLRETKSIFAYIFLHFWGNEEQKNIIKAKFKQDLIEDEEEKKIKFPITNIFESRQKNNVISEENVQLVQYKKENILTKIINKMKKWTMTKE